MKTFDVIYHFGPSDELKATVEAEDLEAARRLAWRHAHYNPSREQSAGADADAGLVIDGRAFYINTVSLRFIEVSEATRKTETGMGFRKRA